MARRTAFPAVGDYFAWARSQGFTVSCRPVVCRGQTYQLARIERPDGRSVLEIFQDEQDSLMSTTVARLDRRLGLKSYLFI